ncbi:MAG: 30S ribosomal protein S15 [Candidatus Margulisbacteria bacterium]|jgi:small subunit ribosomal protein S15|nr:30S ribosomal protein S15 [Candidatus Margulisiibacteriota bacterium]
MPLAKDKKTEIIKKFELHDGDVGSTEVQIALLTSRIEQLVGHLKKNTNDNHSRRGLLMMVGQRKRLLHYLKRTDSKKYGEVTTALELR